MGLFEGQVARFPDRYPWTQQKIKAIQNGLWTESEFTFQSDKHQFRTQMTEEEQQVIVRALSAIGQIEIAVKTFWAKIGDWFPHNSISDLGYVLSYTEVVHGMAYTKLLEVLNFEHIFEENLKVPVIKKRVEYLKKHTQIKFEDDRKQKIYALILFTLFIENVSLFSQFYTVLFFDKSKNLLKDVANQIAYTIQEECYSSDTEVLTPNGWKNILEFSEGDAVYQFTNDMKLEATKVLKTIQRQYDGKLVEFSKKGNRCLVTPNHDMVVNYKSDGANTFRKVKAKDVKLHKEMSIPRRAFVSGGDINHLTSMERLMIAIQADGSKLYWVNKEGQRLSRGVNGGKNVAISLKKPRKIERLRKLLDDVAMDYSERSTPEGYCIFSFHMPEKEDVKSFEWVDTSNKTSNWCREFIQEASLWDGWVTKTGGLGYSSTNYNCIEKMQFIGILAGYHTSVCHKVDNRSEKFNDSWKVNFTEGKLLPISHGISKKEIDYSGTVGCISVPSGMIFTRIGNETFIAGNCLHADVGITLINTLRVEYPELFDDEMNEIVAKEVKDAYRHECKVMDWILGEYNATFTDSSGTAVLNADVLKYFVAERINESMKEINMPFSITPRQKFDGEIKWFNDKYKLVKKTDSFAKTSTAYDKHARDYENEEL